MVHKKTLFPVILSFFLWSCPDSVISDAYLIGFSQCIGSDEWRKQMSEEMYRELECHPDILFLYRDANGDNETQIKQIEELLKSNIDILIVSPNEAEPLTEIVNKVFLAGIPVILLDRKINSEHYTTFIGADNYKVGRSAGNKIISLLNGQGRILEICGLQGSSPAIERHQGFIDAVNKCENIKVIKQVYGKWVPDEAYKELEKNVFPDDSVNFVFAHNDVMGAAAYNFFDSLKIKNIQIIGIDGLAGDGNGIDLVNKKVLTATVLYPTGGEEAIRITAGILNGKKYPKRVILNSTVIDENNAQIMEQQADKMKNQRKTISQLNSKIYKQVKTYGNQRTIIYILAGSFIIVLLLLIRILLSYKVINSQKRIIEDQNQHLETLNNTKDKFFSIIAHDLKSPFNSLLGFSELLLEKHNIYDDETRQKYIRLINQTAKNSYELLENLLLWANIQMHNMQYNEEVFKAEEVILNICKVYKEIAHKKGIALNYSVENSPVIRGDKNQIEFIIRNLINNAIKFTDANGSAKVTANTLPDGYTEIRVSDTGIGISEKSKKNLFTVNKDQSAEGTAGEKGTGLGLILSYEFVKLNGGEISVESREGKGTTFYLRFKS